MQFEDLNIPEPVLKGIKAAGFSSCTSVQEASLPLALEGKDVAVQAQTGTGKTAVFLIALFSRMLMIPGPGRGPSPRALIIAPTRELVAQIHAEAKKLAQFTDFRIAPVFGGMDYMKQKEELGQGVDVIVGTPGRLIDYLKQKVYSLRKTEFLIIDEADRMFDMGFISDLRFLLKRMAPYNSRQSMLFSATLSTRVMELCYEHMNLPEKIVVTPEQMTVKKIQQELYHVGRSEKMGLLMGILKKEPGSRVLIFVNTRAAAERLDRLFKANGMRAAIITGELPQVKRLKILSRFKDGDLPILVATDVAGRGLHIDGVTHVINYDLPQDSEDYVHRIGRTARAGAEGKAITFACEEYVHSLEDIEEFINLKIPVKPVEDSMIDTDFKAPESAPRQQGARPGHPGRRQSGEKHRGSGQGRRDRPRHSQKRP
jgi:ATP-dependent RNA helicase RhlB